MQHLEEAAKYQSNQAGRNEHAAEWRLVPNVHEHVAEEAPHLRSVAGMVDQRALHEVRLIGLQYPLV